MTSSDIVNYVRQIAPDLPQTENLLLNFLDAAQRRLIKKALWPDCWMTTETISGQQEYLSRPVLQVHAVYVGGRLATPTDRATLEGRQIGLYSSVSGSVGECPPSPFPAGAAFPFGPPVVPHAAFTGFIQVTGAITPGDTLTAVVGGISVPYTVLPTDASLEVLVQSLAMNLRANIPLMALAQFYPVIASPTQVFIVQLNNTSGTSPLTLTVSTNVGATEVFTASGAALAGASTGSGGAPGTIGPGAPTWVIAQEPLNYPIRGTWGHGIRPDAQPWGYSGNQPPRYYWRGGKVGIVPNVANAGVTIALDCVRSPDQVVTMGQQLTTPIDWREALAADVLRQAYMGSADTKSITLAQMWESSYKDYEKEILLWRGTFENEAAGTYRMQTQRFRMGLGDRFHKRRR